MTRHLHCFRLSRSHSCLPSNMSAQQCPGCYNDTGVMPGHGGRSGWERRRVNQHIYRFDLG